MRVKNVIKAKLLEDRNIFFLLELLTIHLENEVWWNQYSIGQNIRSIHIQNVCQTRMKIKQNQNI